MKVSSLAEQLQETRIEMVEAPDRKVLTGKRFTLQIPSQCEAM
jgi:hypothetical protein